MTRACVALLIVLIVPGVLSAPLLRLRLRSLTTWAVIPALSLALTFVVGELTQVLGVRFGVAAWLAGAAALATLAALARRPPTRLARAGESATDISGRVSVVLLGVAMLLGVAIWVHGIGGHGLAPPGADAAHHGFFVARVEKTHSIDVEDVLVSETSGRHRSAAFYPLAMHASAAIASEISGADIGRVLVAITVIFASLVLPLGMFVLARRLVPDVPLAAGMTALAVPILALFPYSPIQFGDVAVIVGMALVPVSVVFLLDAAVDDPDERRRSGERVVAAGLVLLCAVAVHSSQMPLLVLLVALLVLERTVRLRSWDVVARAAIRGLAVAFIAALAFAPTLHAFAQGVSERSSFDNTPTRSFSAVVRPVLALDSGAFQHPRQQMLLALLSAVGAVAYLARRRVAWALGHLFVVGVALLTATSDNPVGRALSLPWYRGASRVGWNQAYFVSLFAGFAAALMATRVARSIGGGPRRLVVSVTSVVALFAVSIGYQGASGGAALLERSFAHDAIVSTDSNAAFAWLRDHAGTADVVVNDVNRIGISVDDSLWMYALADLDPMFGWGLPVERTGFAAASPEAVRDFADRYYLLTHLGALGRDARATRLARRFHARWVYLDERTITGFRHTLSLAALRRAPQLRQVFRSGSVHVFRVLS